MSTPERSPPEHPGAMAAAAAADPHQGRQSPWRARMFLALCLAGAAGAVALLRWAARAHALGEATSSAAVLRLPPEVLREYQDQIAALANARARANDEEHHAHAERLALAGLEEARRGHDERIAHLEQIAAGALVRPEAASGTGADVHAARDPGLASPVEHSGPSPGSGAAGDRREAGVEQETGGSSAGDPLPTRAGSCQIGAVACALSDLPALIAAVAPACAHDIGDEERHAELVAFLILRAPVMARRVQGIARPQAALVEVIAAESERCAQLPRPASWDAERAAGPAGAQLIAATIHGALLARAVADGGWPLERLAERAQTILSQVPAAVAAGLDTTRIRACAARILAYLWLPALVPQTVAEVLDADVAMELETVLRGHPIALRWQAQTCAAIQGAAALLALAHAGAASPGAAREQLHQAIRRADAQARALEQADSDISDRLIPDYATLFALRRRDWSTQVPIAAHAAAVAVEAADADRSPSATSSDEDLIRPFVAAARAAAESVLAQTACGDLVDEALERLASTCSAARIAAARAESARRIDQAIGAPMAREFLVRTAVSIAQDAAAQARGTRRLAARPPAAAATPSGAAPTEAQRAQASMGSDRADAARVEGGTGGTLVHLPVTATVSRPVVIPAGSYANARVLLGVVCELGVVAPETMLVSLDYAWSGPSGRRLRMKDLRVVAECTAYSGNRRVHARIVRLSLSPPGHAQITVAASGWLGDNVIGAGGVIGQGWDWNPDVVLPLAGAQGLLSAVAGALKPNQQVTSVNVSTTVVDEEHQPASAKAAGTAAQSLGDGTSQQLDRILSQLRPALMVPNNQEVTVALSDDAVLPIPVEEFDDVVEADEAGAGRGFAH